MSDAPSYGYGKRPPTSTGRVIPANTPPSRITSPDSSSSRKVSAVAKQVLEDTVPIWMSRFTAPSVGVLTDLNTLAVPDGGPPAWSAWEYNAIGSTYQCNTFTAIQNNTLSTNVIARTNVNVMTERMRNLLWAYRAADATGNAIYMAMGVPETAIGSYINTDYWRVGLVRQGSGTANVVAEYVPRTGVLTSLTTAVSAIPWTNNSSLMLWADINGGNCDVYTNTVNNFDTATFRLRFPIPTSHWDWRGQIRNKRAGLVIDRGSSANFWLYRMQFQSSPGEFV
jgi:hypothetical protein